MEKFCKDLKEHAMRIVNYEKSLMKNKTFATYVNKNLILMMTMMMMMMMMMMIKSIKK